MRAYLLALAAIASLWARPALGQAPVEVADSCLAIDHFPSQPVGNAPSKAVLYVMLPAEWGGGTITVEFSGASGELTGGGPIDDGGLAVAELPLHSFGDHQIEQVEVESTSLGAAPVDLNDLPEGGSFTVDQTESECDPASLQGAAVTTAPTTTAVPTTTASTVPPTTVTTAATTPPTTVATFVVESPLPASPVAALPWPWLLIGSGALAALIGLFLLRKKSCDDLYQLWQAAQSRYDTCAEELTKARAWLEEKRAERVRAEAELADLERSAATGTISHGGASYQSLPGEGLVTVAGMADIISTTRAQVDQLRQSEAIGEEMVDNWRKRTEEAAAEAQQARAAYEACTGAASASAGGPAMTNTADAGAGGMAVTTAAETRSECPEGARRVVALAPARSFRIYRAFRIETSSEGEAWAQESGKELAVDLMTLGTELGFVGALLGAHGAGTRVAGGVMTGSASGLMRGGAEGYAAAYGNLGTAGFPVPVPTSPQEVLVGVLQLIAQLAGTVAGKASEWTERRALHNFRLVKEYQLVTVQPFQIEICEGGVYRCLERVRQYSLGDAGSETGGWRDGGQGLTDMDRSRHQREVRILINQGQQSMERSVTALIEYEQAFPVGPCR